MKKDEPVGFCGICKKKTPSKHIITNFYSIPRNDIGGTVCNGPKRAVTSKDRNRRE